VDWSPTSDVRLRYSYDRAVRAPNVQELFSPASVLLDSSITSDPCAGATPKFTLAQCERTGITAAQYGGIVANPSAQYNGLQGGNPHLQPEIADTRSFGVVFTPSFVPGLAASIDYYNIYFTGLIGVTGATNILDQCALTGSASFCGLVHRAPTTGSLWLSTAGYIVDTELNTGYIETDGIDLDLKYGTPLPAGFGHLSANLAANWLHEFVVEPYIGAAKYDCAGLYGSTCSNGVETTAEPLPKFRSRFTTTWATPWLGLDATLTWRHIQRTTNEGEYSAEDDQ
jgi:outer membrane receptor protein involved in Fe transport